MFWKLDNVLTNGDEHCKVADFWLSKLGIFNGHKIEAYGGTPCYMAPEVFITLFEMWMFSILISDYNFVLLLFWC